MNRTRIILTLAFLMTTFSLFSQTYVSGGIFADTTWHASNSPYIVKGDIAIYPGYTLIIEAGTEVKFDKGFRLIVRGLLELQGTENNKIIITSNATNPSVGDWKGIEIENDQGGEITGSYVQGSYADHFIKIQSYSTGDILNLNNSKISNCNFAFYGYDKPSNFTVSLLNDTITDNNYGFIYAQNLTVTNCKFSNGEKGIHGWEEEPDITIKNSEFSNFSIWPFNLQGLIDSCHIHNNAVGIRMKPSLEVRNCLIELNDVGVAAEYPYQVQGEKIYNNKIFNNTIYNFKHLYNYPINIPNNCWRFDNKEDISLTIYDAYDDVSLGIVTFTPFSCESVITSINGSYEIQQDYIFPNPSSDYVKIYPEKKILYEIYSMNGILMLKGEYNKGIDVSSMSNGLYLIKTIDTKDGDEVKYFKLLKN